MRKRSLQPRNAAADKESMKRIHAVALVLTVLLAGAALKADTLILRDGRRVQGTLLSIRNGVVEFEESRGFAGRRTVRYDRDEVQRIDLDESGSSSSGSNGNTSVRPAGLRER